jgi:hypothetical protein
MGSGYSRSGQGPRARQFDIGDQTVEAITMLAEAIGKPLDPSMHPEPIASGDPQHAMQAVRREGAE